MTRRWFVHSSSARLATILMVGAAAFVVALPTPAKAYLYWVDRGGVVRADLNGRDIDSNFVQGVPGDLRLGIALTSQYIYISSGPDVIGRADLNGTHFAPNFTNLAPTDVGPGFGPTIGSSLAVDGSYIYWAVPDEGDIGRCQSDGGDVEPRFIRTQPFISALAVGAGRVYWASAAREIGRASLSGTDVEPDLIRLETSAGHPVQLVVAGGYIYWNAPSGRSIGRANLQGGHVEPHFIVSAHGSFSNPAVGGGYIYWRNEEQQRAGLRMWIARANINGSHVRQHFMNVTGEITGELVADSLGPGGVRTPRRRPIHGRPSSTPNA